MTKLPQKQLVPTAVTDHSRQRLQYPHVTTGNFMEFGVADAIELAPDTKINNARYKNFTRLNSMPAPTFGDAMIHNKTFFVPYRVVMPSWQDFTDSLAHVDSVSVDFVDRVHTIYNNDFVEFFMLEKCSEMLDRFIEMPDIRETTGYDFVIYNYRDEEIQCYNFTEYGRRCWKILQSLGYKFTPQYYAEVEEGPEEHSALPLLSLAKIYMDWYFPSAYVHDEIGLNILTLFEYDNNSFRFCDWFHSGVISKLEQIFDVINYVCYDTDLFVSAFDNPVSQNTYTSPISLNDITEFNPQVPNEALSLISAGSNIFSGTPYYEPLNEQLTQYGMTALKSLTDYVKRHQLSGSRNIDNYLSRWGIILDSDKLRLSLHLNSYNQFVEFGDVFSTADTSDAKLGDYAGKGYSMGSANFSFDCQEFGMLITISTIVPMIDYYQGAARHTKHFEKFDFYSPEFDNLGVQALSTHEVFCPSNVMYLMTQREREDVTLPDVNSYAVDNSVFGFVPRYAEYKVGRSKLTGDFALESMNTGFGAWHLMRDLIPYFEYSGRKTKHSRDFVLGTDSRQYDRLFYSDRSLGDTFKIYHMFDYDITFPGKSLYDSYEFTDEDKAKKVAVDTGGVKAN